MNKPTSATSTFGIQGAANGVVIPRLKGFIEVHCTEGTQLFPVDRVHLEKNPNGLAIIHYDGERHEIYETYEDVVIKMRCAQ